MTRTLARIRAVFVEEPARPAVDAASQPHFAVAATASSRRADAAAAGFPPAPPRAGAVPSRPRGAWPARAAGDDGVPVVAVLCAPGRARAAAAVAALAVADAVGAPAALAMALGSGAPAGAFALPAASRAATRLRRLGMPASGAARLVWLADRRAQLASAWRDDRAGVAAAASVELHRAAGIAGMPAALAIPLARTPALDRVVAWHDGVLAITDADTDASAPAPLSALVLASLAALDRRVAPLALPPRRAVAVAVAGLRAPAAARDAIAQLLHGGADPAAALAGGSVPGGSGSASVAHAIPGGTA